MAEGAALAVSTVLRPWTPSCNARRCESHQFEECRRR